MFRRILCGVQEENFVNRYFIAAFKAESKLFRSVFSVAVFISAALILTLITVYIASDGDRYKTPGESREVYERRLAETEAELALYDDPSSAQGPIGGEDVRTALLVRRALLLRYLSTDTDANDYILIYPFASSFSDYSQSSETYNSFAIVIPVFGVLCLARGIWRISTLSGDKAKMRLSGDCSRGNCFGAGVALDSIVLGALLTVVAVLRGVIAASASTRFYYFTEGPDVTFGSVHELFFAQFAAAVVFGAAAYFGGCLSASVTNRMRALAGGLLSVAAIGMLVAIGALLDYVVPDAPFMPTNAPLLGIAFCQGGFREYIWYLQFAACAAAAVAFALLARRRYCRRVEIG